MLIGLARQQYPGKNFQFIPFSYETYEVPGGHRSSLMSLLAIEKS